MGCCVWGCDGGLLVVVEGCCCCWWWWRGHVPCVRRLNSDAPPRPVPPFRPHPPQMASVVRAFTARGDPLKIKVMLLAVGSECAGLTLTVANQ